MSGIHTNSNTEVFVDLKKTSSIDDLFLAHRAAHQGARIEVTDVIDRVFKLQIVSLAHEDGSGKSLIVSGYAETIQHPTLKVEKLPVTAFEAWISFKGGERRGWIKKAKHVGIQKVA